MEPTGSWLSELIRSWPFAAIVIAVAFFLAFRRPVSRLIDRIQGVSRNGVVAPPRPQVEQTPEEDEEEEGSEADELLRQLDNTLIVRAEEAIQTELNERQIQSVEDREQVLTRYLAAVYIATRFLQVYQTIYGSQISALEFLNTASQNGVAVDSLQPLYSQAASDYPQVYDHYSFDDWLQYLVAVRLVDREGGTVSIRLEGREFLKFLTDQGLTKLKLF